MCEQRTKEEEVFVQDMTTAIQGRSNSGAPATLERADMRARDDFLVSSWSGLLAPRHAPAEPPAPGVLVGQGACVSCRDGYVGHLERVLVDPDTDDVRALIVGMGNPAARAVRVPAFWVEAVAEDQIILTWRPTSG